MYKTTMLSGDTPPTTAESMLRLVQASLITSRSSVIDASTWTLDLLSPFWRLYVHDAPGAVLTVAGASLPIRPDRALLVPAWVPLSTAIEGQIRQDYLHFVLTGFPATVHRMLFTGPIELRTEELAAGLLAQWRASLDGPPDQSPGLDGYAWAAATAYAGLAAVFGRLSADQRALCQHWLSGSADLRPALEAIEQRLGDPPSNAELATLCGLSINHLIRRFRASVGLSPARYGQERRVAVAASWLLDPQRKVEDIAEAAGFSDRFHFSRAFRAHFGIAPVAWRQRHGADQQGS